MQTAQPEKTNAGSLLALPRRIKPCLGKPNRARKACAPGFMQTFCQS